MTCTRCRSSGPPCLSMACFCSCHDDPTTYRVVRLPEPSPPPHPRQAPNLAWIIAWIEAALAWGDTAHGSGMAQFELAWSRLLARYDADLNEDVPAWVATETRGQLLGPDALDFVLGYIDRDGEWIPGVAGLAEPEREAIQFWLEPDPIFGARRTTEQVWQLMTRRKGHRRGERLAYATVEQYLSRARGKLLRYRSQLREEIAS
jgi:hypothetical protein